MDCLSFVKYMSDSAYLVGAFLPRKRTASGAIAVVDDETVSRVEATTACLGMNPAMDMRPVERQLGLCRGLRLIVPTCNCVVDCRMSKVLSSFFLG